MIKGIKILLLMSVLITLSGCESFLKPNQNDLRAARCKQMNHDIVFNGATAIDYQAWQQRAQMEKLEQSYLREDCSG